MNPLILMRKGLNRWNQGTVLGCRFLTIGIMALITLVVCAGVFWRYFLNDALSWTEETAKFLMVWLVFIGSPIALKHGGHAAIDTLPGLLAPRFRQGLFALIYLIVLALMFVLIQQGYGFALNARSQSTATTQVSMMYVFGAMPVGGLLMFPIALELLIQSIIGIFRPEEGLHLSNIDLGEGSGL